LIHFNFGLHDLKHVDPATRRPSDDPEHPSQVDVAVYAKLLDKICTKLKGTGANVVFATTTPVPEGKMSPFRHPKAVETYNRAARQIMELRDIAVNDLYGFALPHLEEWQRPANVHFKEEGSKALGERVAEVIREQLKP
jgi:acyl-CoA thioesterase-1